MAQIFGPYANSALRGALLFLAASPAIGLFASYAVPRTPFVTGEGLVVAQPVPFSHKHHVGEDGLDCRYCHMSVETSTVADLPPTHVCMTCHSQLFTSAPPLSPVRESLAKGEPIAWRRVYQLPGYVYFDHSIHVAKGVGCTTCHGQVDQMALLYKAQPLTMGWCLNCHREPEKYLRRREDVFSLSWSPPADQLSLGNELLAHYLIDKGHLTDCSVCHR